MSNEWGKEDKAAWRDSEVAQEFEKKILRVISTLDGISKSSSTIDEVKDLATNAPSISQSINGIADAVERLDADADDGVEYSEAPSDEDDDASDSPNDVDVVANVIDRLRILLKKATDSRDIELAYKIERTIDEILDEE